MNRYLLIRRLYGPAYLLLTGVLALLAQTTDFGWGKSWPLYLLLAGALKLAEFIVVRTDAPQPPPPGWQPGQAYPGQPYPGQTYPGQPYAGYPQPQTAPVSAEPGTAIVPSEPPYEEKK